MADVERTLPEGVETEMGPIATAMGEIYQYTLESDRRTAAAETRSPRSPGSARIQDWVVTPLLKSVPGVTEINSFGGYLQQYQVLVDPDKLLKYDLSVDAVADAIRNNNSNVGGNVVSRASEQYIIRGVGLIRSEDDIRKIVLKAESGTPVSIRDVGEVRIDHAIRQGASQKNGHREVVGRHRDDAARREQPRGRQERRGEGPRDQREPRAAGRPADRAVLRALVDRREEHATRC